MINPGSVPDPVRQMRERESRVRTAVVWALGQLHAAEATPILKQAADDVNSMVRDAANEALAKIQENQERNAGRAGRLSRGRADPIRRRPHELEKFAGFGRDGRAVSRPLFQRIRAISSGPIE